MFRLKTIFGGTLKFRNIDNQAAELLLQCQLLDRMTHLGKPETEVVPHLYYRSLHKEVVSIDPFMQQSQYGVKTQYY